MKAESNRQRSNRRSNIETGCSLVRLLTAIHEAAHAIVAWATGRRIILVKIIREKFSPPRIEFDRLPVHINLESPRNRASAERETMTGLGGVLAERKFLGQGWRSPPSPTDFSSISSLAVHALRSGEPLESYLDRIAARVSVLLDLYWSHVKTIALALLDRGELSGREVHALLRDNRRPLRRMH
jgi:hypothetical protein